MTIDPTTKYAQDNGFTKFSILDPTPVEKGKFFTLIFNCDLKLKCICPDVYISMKAEYADIMFNHTATEEENVAYYKIYDEPYRDEAALEKAEKDFIDAYGMDYDTYLDLRIESLIGI